MNGVVHDRPIRQVETNQRRIGGTQDRGVQIHRRLFQQPGDIRGPPCRLETERGAYRQAALIYEQPQADHLRHGQGRHDQNDQLNSQAIERPPHHSMTSTSAARQYPPLRTVVMILGRSTSGSILRRSRLIWLSIVRSSGPAVRPAVRSSS